MVAAALVLVVIALLVTLEVFQVRRVGRERHAVFDAVLDLLSEPSLDQRATGYPRLAGVYRREPVKLELVTDSLVERRLPKLYLVLTVKRRLEIQQPVDVLLRPHPADTISPGADFACDHPLPSGWPPDVRIVTPDRWPPPSDVLSVIRPLTDDPRTKHVLVAPGGLRIAWEVARAEVGPYRLVRRSRFKLSLSREELVSFLDTGRRLGEQVSAALV